MEGAVEFVGDLIADTVENVVGAFTEGEETETVQASAEEPDFARAMRNKVVAGGFEPETVAVAAEPEAPKYPQHDKLSKVALFSQKIGEFVDWMGDAKDIYLAEMVREPGVAGHRDLMFARTGIQALLAEFFDIDEKALSNEKDAMLAELQARANKQ